MLSKTRRYPALYFWDLSAVFDTIDHHLLLNHLKYRFGVQGTKHYSGYNPTLGSEDRE